MTKIFFGNKKNFFLPMTKNFDNDIKTFFYNGKKNNFHEHLMDIFPEMVTLIFEWKYEMEK